MPGPDDATLVLAARLLREGLRPRLALEPGALDGRDFPRGSLALLVHDHRRQPAAGLRERLGAALAGLPLEARPLESGRGDGDLPDLGGQRFRLLVPPRVAILGHGARIQPNVFGFQWHYLDRELGLAPTVLAEPRLAATDLRRYNVIVLPDAQGDLAPDAEQALLAWVRAGGTLIASGASAARLARAGGPLAESAARRGARGPRPLPRGPGPGVGGAQAGPAAAGTALVALRRGGPKPALAAALPPPGCRGPQASARARPPGPAVHAAGGLRRPPAATASTGWPSAATARCRCSCAATSRCSPPPRRRRRCASG
ncbi:MAG: hypothetical protein RML12_07685 [Xanthomonadales bacterium]|nr:hypothetical protein [Xanthomonadales bacterium]